MFIAVSPSLGISTLPELIARAKKAPGEITYATTGVGRLTHLTGELLQREAGIKLLVVPYTGGPSHAVTDVATERVAMIIEGYSGVVGAARSGSIKLIAVASAKRLAEFPDVPTVAETIPGFQATTSDWCSSPAAQASFAAPGRESLCEQAIAVGELDATARSG